LWKSVKSWKKDCTRAISVMYISFQLHRSLTAQTKDYTGTYYGGIVLSSIGVFAAAAIVWLYKLAFENRDWNKRSQLQEKRRRGWSFALWAFGLITTFVPIKPCYEPEFIYEAVHCQLPLLIDALATFECLCVSYFLLTCSGTKYHDWVGWVIGLLGCCLSLLSSIGGLGSITNSLIAVSNWYFGAIGFFVATLPRSYTQRVIPRFWRWMKKKLGYVEVAEQPEEIAL
jgi:cbb3-type cytochrome oxidase subunit 1